jgi:hypothetical protein
MPAPAATLEVAVSRFSSQVLAVGEEDGRAALRREREITGPGGDSQSVQSSVRLDRVTAGEVAAEGAALGFVAEPHRHVMETEEYLGATVVVLRAPPPG